MISLPMFWLFSSPNVTWVVSGSMLLGATAGLIGCFAFLRKQALAGDALAHATLPGVATAFLIFHSRQPLVLALGAIISCGLAYAVLEYLVRATKIKQDAALAIVLSLFFALGVFQLSIIQRNPLGAQSGLDKLLFGQAAALMPADLIQLAAVGSVLLILVFTFFRPLRMVCFDRSFACVTGLRVKAYEGLLALMIVVAVVIGIQLVGVVLMAALLLIPAATARFWTERLATMLFLAGLFGALSGVIGAYVSYLAPRMPTGPWIVVALCVLFTLSLFFAPDKGLVLRWVAQRRFRQRVHDENILRTMFKLAEIENTLSAPIPLARVMTYRSLQRREFDESLERLNSRGFVVRQDETVLLTSRGLEEARKITARHRLWEVYLNRQLKLPADHVHEGAEVIEHVLTPDLEQAVKSELGKTTRDPHGKTIPGVED